ncbi:MAG: GNAT family N-acetyltransferase [Promethearchaeota archaeon]
MQEAAEIIKSNYDLYKDFIHEEDLPEYLPDQNWIDKNYAMREFYLLKYKDKYIGVSSFQKIENFAYIGYFFIKNGFHRKGFGTILLRYIEYIAKMENLNEIFLFTHPEADFALNFYKKHGYEIIETDRENILRFRGGILKDFYEKGSYLLRKKIN